METTSVRGYSSIEGVLTADADILSVMFFYPVGKEVNSGQCSWRTVPFWVLRVFLAYMVVTQYVGLFQTDLAAFTDGMLISIVGNSLTIMCDILLTILDFGGMQKIRNLIGLWQETTILDASKIQKQIRYIKVIIYVARLQCFLFGVFVFCVFWQWTPIGRWVPVFGKRKINSQYRQLPRRNDATRHHQLANVVHNATSIFLHRNLFHFPAIYRSIRPNLRFLLFHLARIR